MLRVISAQRFSAVQTRARPAPEQHEDGRTPEYDRCEIDLRPMQRFIRMIDHRRTHDAHTADWVASVPLRPSMLRLLNLATGKLFEPRLPESSCLSEQGIKSHSAAAARVRAVAAKTTDSEALPIPRESSSHGRAIRLATSQDNDPAIHPPEIRSCPTVHPASAAWSAAVASQSHATRSMA